MACLVWLGLGFFFPWLAWLGLVWFGLVGWRFECGRGARGQGWPRTVRFHYGTASAAYWWGRLAKGEDFGSGLARMGFVCGALDYRPFLGPLYNWNATADPDILRRFPPFV